MAENFDIFDMMGDEGAKYKPIKSNDWKWSFKDYPKPNGLKVFSCFACGGGSTMGYKLAGCEVLGCVEIDPKMIEVYKKNHNPKYAFLMDIRDFNDVPNEELPEELFDLDILDGSPRAPLFRWREIVRILGAKRRSLEKVKPSKLWTICPLYLSTPWRS